MHIHVNAPRARAVSKYDRIVPSVAGEVVPAVHSDLWATEADRRDEVRPQEMFACKVPACMLDDHSVLGQSIRVLFRHK